MALLVTTAPSARRAPARRVLPLLAWSAALTAVLLWPLTRSGHLLGHDLVFTPRQPLDLASAGVSSASPRAVPLDALVALAERLADGAVVGRLALVLPLLAAGVGCGLLLGGRSAAARLATCGFAVWNPYVIERLALGQWALLWAYAALPWLVIAVARGRGASGWAARAAALAAASITPTGGLIAAATATTVAASTRRDTRRVAALALLLQLPWAVPALTSGASATSDPAAVAAFAARAERAGGVLLSLLGGGGIWDAEVVPGSRGGVLPWLGLAVLAAAAAVGARHLRDDLLGLPVFRALAVLAGAGLVLGLASSAPGSDALVRAVVAHVPGGGLLRDAQKWIMPLVLLEVLLIGAAVDVGAARLRAVQWRALLTVTVLSAPLLLLPDAAATLRPTVEPVHYPRDWAVVADAARDGTATVLPLGSYRLFGWAPGRSVLDPAPRLLQVPTVVDDRLSVSGRVLRGEDPRAARVVAAVERALAGPAGPGTDPAARLAADLAAAGVRWVVVERGTPGPLPPLSGLERVHSGRDVALYRVPGDVVAHEPSTARVVAVLASDGLTVAVLLVLLLRPLGEAARRTRRRGTPGRS